MIKLTRINLLPYREEARKAKQKQFTKILILAGVIGVGISALGFLGLEQAVNNQESRNEYLNSEIANLDKKIAEVKKLNEEKDAFLTRKKKVEELQNQRFLAAQMLNNFNVLLPDGAYLTTLKSNGAHSYTLTGKATSDNKVAMFMKSLPSTGVFNFPELENIKKDADAQSFTLKVSTVLEERPEEEEE